MTRNSGIAEARRLGWQPTTRVVKPGRGNSLMRILYCNSYLSLGPGGPARLLPGLEGRGAVGWFVKLMSCVGSVVEIVRY